MTITAKGQSDSIQVDKKILRELLGAIEAVGGLVNSDAGPEDPIRKARARRKNAKATRASRRELKRIQFDYERGTITYSDYIHLKAAELGITVQEYIDRETLIKTHSLYEKPDN